YLTLAQELTDANAAVFDAAHGFAGCIPGIHEVLRRQGLLAGTWCLDPGEVLSPGQAEEITRVCEAYPHLTDDEFVREHLDKWLT
ncbi:MAG: dihydrodipicolinate synthase family protein, partial [Spirochaetes bacterium]|nr:dihydrodipicolinate synthase family protein [Spirochaetota bacterium]